MKKKIVSFIARTWMQGNSIIITIPSYHRKFEGIEKGKLYRVTLEEIKDAKNPKTQH